MVKIVWPELKSSVIGLVERLLMSMYEGRPRCSESFLMSDESGCPQRKKKQN